MNKKIEEKKLEEDALIHRVDFDSNDQPIIPNNILDSYDYWDNKMEEACARRSKKLKGDL